MTAQRVIPDARSASRDRTNSGDARASTSHT